MKTHLAQTIHRPLRLSAEAMPHGIPALSDVRTRLGTKSLVLSCLLFLVAGISFAQLGETDPEQQKRTQPDFYQQERNQRMARDEQEKFRFRISIENAVGDNVPLAFPKAPPVVATAATKSMSNSNEMIPQGAALITVSIVVVMLGVRILSPGFFKAMVRRLNPWSDTLQPVTSSTTEVREEDKAFGEFLAAFNAGPRGSPGQLDAGEVGGDFHATAARFITTLRRLLEEINGAAEDLACHRMLADLGREVTAFKSDASSPEFLPVWQLVSALEGLLKQLSDKAGNVTRSTIRTVVGAVDLLEELCKPGVRKDLLTNPPMKFMAVDDDVICRTAVSLALKKALNQPDLAENGEAALALAASQPYDVIFLDIQMPGMDGFELCSKIHETSANPKTPVIFITGMGDFDARVQSIVSGGSDLMGKPFLTFEITVKALTFALGRRLHSKDKAVTDRDVVTSAMAPVPSTVSTNESATLPGTVPTSAQNCVVGVPPDTTLDTDRLTMAMRKPNTEAVVVPDSLPADNLDRAFLARATTSLAALRGILPKTTEAMDETARQDMLADIYLGLHALTPGSDSAHGHPAMRLVTALEGMVRKLLENPKHWTSSALLTIANALDLMEDLCSCGTKAELETNSPIHMLVVDDDPVSRRAIACALQMTFGKPESAENGEAALALAKQTAFDMIFMDVQMPGMDGFTACSKIRQTTINHRTPVVFVTGKVDGSIRAQAATSGGNGIIAKPFLMSEVTVKALTFFFQGRLQEEYSQEQSATNAPPITPAPQAANQTHKLAAPVELTADPDTIASTLSNSDSEETDQTADQPDDNLERTFLSRASTDIAALRSLIPETPESMDATVRQDTLADLYVGLHELTPKIDPARGHPALRLIAALAGLIKKLLDDPNYSTLSALLTIVNALDLMEELCASDVNTDFAVNPPIRILVAEDDPIARRAISSALKVTFGEPEIVENGEAVLALATEKAFDIIFMDVQMPDMDGFAACSRIRQTKTNGDTPVVFITAPIGSNTRVEVATSGGNGLITKPFVKSEVTVKALTFAFRSRLRQLYASSSAGGPPL